MDRERERIELGGKGHIRVLFGSDRATFYKWQIASSKLKDIDLCHGPFCLGVFRIKKISESYKCIFCSECGLRLEFNAEIDSVGRLKQYFEKEAS